MKILENQFRHLTPDDLKEKESDTKVRRHQRNPRLIQDESFNEGSFLKKLMRKEVSEGM